MIRFIRAVLYGAFAAIAATLILDWLDRKRPPAGQLTSRSTARPRSTKVENMDDEARKALLDELAAQV
jgi:hypothetical protein